MFKHTMYVGVILSVTAMTPCVRSQDSTNVLDKVMAIRRAKLIEELGLDQTKEKAFLKTYNEYVSTERKLAQDKAGIFRRLVHMSALGTDVASDKILQTIGEFKEAERKLQAHREDGLSRLEKTLEPWQLARLIVFEEKFHLKVRELMFDMRHKGRGWRGGNFPPLPPDEGDVE